MGGDTVTPLSSDHEEESSLGQDFAQSFSRSRSLFRDNLSMKVEDETINGDNGLVFGESDEMGPEHSAASLHFEADQRRRRKVYKEVLQSYNRLPMRSESLKEAKSKILSYTPGAWIEKAGGMKLSDYDVPKTTSLVLIGPKGSGKSSLVNRISKVFEDDKFASERAQVSYNSSFGDGTYFLQEYMIPRGSTSFCLYDTRSLGFDSSDNINMIKCWITKGLRHGELVVRDSDSSTLKDRLKRKARGYGCQFSEIRMINFVIFVVNGLEVLKSMENDGDYTQIIATDFNCPYLSFKDDKPAVVVTHGDLLSLADRARICVHLGELLGIPPAKQIFDIPESSDPVTELTIVDMMRYSLEHSDRNLRHRNWVMDKVRRVSPSSCIRLLIILGITIISGYMQYVHKHRAHKLKPHIDWPAIRHMWLE